MMRLSGKLGYVVCERQTVYDSVDFYVLGIALKGYQMVPNTAHDLKRIRKRILEAVIYAQDHLKADVVGLGALTASLTDGGKWLMKQNLTCKLTHGNTYATLIAEQGVTLIINNLKLENPLIAIVGAYGVIGSALAKLLTGRFRLLLAGKNSVALERIKAQLEGTVATTVNLEDLKEADIVITATSHPESLLLPHQLKTGAVVYDLSQPHNVGPEVTAARPDIIRVDGSLIRTPGVVIGFDPATGADETYACLGETLLTGLEGIERNATGDIDLAYLEELREIGQRRGFTHAEFTSFGKQVDVRKNQ
jgi:predicted amino acid dehydrogenase